MVEKQLEEGVRPNEIAFLAFTRKAASEARERAAKRFNFDPEKDLYYFRTLHSFAFHMSDVQGNQLMKDEHLSDLGK